MSEPANGMTPAARELALQIAHCEVMEAVLAGGQSPCQEVVDFQTELGIAPANHHLAEPWSGDIERAPILFISSNPSINDQERYPTRDQTEWSDEAVVGFFHDRLRPTSAKPSHYWSSVHGIAVELLGSTQTRVTPGEDYALTEVVRCKSHKERGVWSAVSKCAPRYLDATLLLSPARCLVVLGEAARRLLETQLGPLNLGAFMEAELGGRHRGVLTLAHPSGFATPKTIRHLAEPERQRLFAFLKVSAG
jgi:hypothetical protein